jgi:outer membrane protein OmpA-like peptidoglycan-associated protein
MEMTLIDRAKSYLTPEVIERTSALVGESQPVTEKALTTATTALAAGVTAEGAAPAGAGRLLHVIEEAGLRGPMGRIAERLAPDSGEDLVQRGQSLLSRVFGARVGTLTVATASAAGVKPAAMSAILGLAAPLVMGVLGSEVHAHKLDAGGLAALLANQKDAARRALPAGVATALGLAPAGRRERPPQARQPSERSQRFWPLLFIIPALVLGALLLRQRGEPAATTEPPAVSEPAAPRLGVGLPREAPAVQAPAPAPAAPATPAPAADLPSYAGGSAVQEMAIFLGSPGDPSRRFVFDELTFDLESARLTPDAQPTLDGVAAILSAHPEVEVLVEGHTDDTGVPAGNDRLSLDRAESVKRGLVERGVSPDRVATAGLGASRPVASNDTAEGRARNRRTEVVITRR